MQQSVLHQFTLLCGSALLTLTSCTAQTDIKSSLQPTELSTTNSSQTEQPLVVADQSPSQPTDNSTDGNPLNADQKTQLTKLDITVVLPKYLPSGFQLVRFEARKGTELLGTDPSFYRISYQGPNNTCLEVGSGYQNSWISPPIQERSLPTPIGTFRISSGKYRNQTSITTHFAVLFKGRAGEADSGQVLFTGGKLAYSSDLCNPIEVEEFDKVLQSAEILAVASADEQSSAKPIGNLLSQEQMAKLTRLPIPIVAPTDLPDGFRVVVADGESGKYVNGDDDSGYTIEYQRNDNTCFAITSSKDSPRRLPQVGQVESAIGTVKIYEETYESKRSLHSFIPVKGNPVMTSPISRLNPTTGKYEACKALDRTEYERILKSIKLLK